MASAPVQDRRVAVARPEEGALIAFQKELDQRRQALESSAASGIDPSRFRGIVLATFSRTPGLWECDPVTVARAVVEASQLGLEPTGLMGGAYLVPIWNSKARRKECQLIVGYRGLVELARRSGEILMVEAEVVRAADEFAYERGLTPQLRHVPAFDAEDRGEMTHVYAIATYRAGAKQFDLMSAAEIEAIAARSRSKDKDGNLVGPWVSDPFEMAKKTVLRRLSKLLPLTVEARRAIEQEDQFEGGSPTVAAIPPRRQSAPSRIAARITGEATNDGGSEAPSDVAGETDVESGSLGLTETEDQA